jgi:flagellar biosynthesis/type III secretory pathway protein FliH
MQNHGISKKLTVSGPLGLLILALLGLSLLACAKPPTEEMENAASAVTRAENDPDAVTYAGSTLTRARDALNRMRAEAESKRYDAAKNYAAEAVSAAEKAIADGRAAAAQAREEASALLGQVKTSLEETGKSLENAKEVKNTNLDFNALDQDYDSARRNTAQAELSLAGNNYQDSIEKSRTARGILSGIDTRLAGAVTAVSRKK